MVRLDDPAEFAPVAALRARTNEATDATFEADQVDVTINGVTVCRGGAIGDPREGVDLTGRAITIDVDLKAGDEQATIWTNDLSIAYVHENSAYST